MDTTALKELVERFETLQDRYERLECLASIIRESDALAESLGFGSGSASRYALALPQKTA